MSKYLLAGALLLVGCNTTPGGTRLPNEDPYYVTCEAARKAGVAPIQEGDPGYRPALDRDGDGTACDN